MQIPQRNHNWSIPTFDFSTYATTTPPRFRNLILAEAEGQINALTVPAEGLLNFTPPRAPQPYKAGADPNIRAWIEWYEKIANGVTANTGNKLQIVGKAAILTGRADLKQKARELALEISRKWDPDGGSHMKYGDLQAADLLRGIGYCYDASFELLTPKERKELEETIYIRGKQFYDEVNPFRGIDAQNHPWDQAQAAAFAACAIPQAPHSPIWFNFVARLYAYRFLSALGFDGENNEGLSYWSYGLGLAVRFLTLAQHTVHANYFTHPWIKNTARFPLYCAPQEGFEISFADNGRPNHAPRGPRDRSFVRRLAVAVADPIALWYAGVPQENVLQAIPPMQKQSVIYPHLGITVFNTFAPDARENVAVGFHSGKFFAGHQHADQNGFVINAYGDKLAIDGGYYDWWGSKHFLGYSTQTAAHNTILVDGAGQSFNTEHADGRLVNAFDSADFSYAWGDASAPLVYKRKIKRFDRQLLFIKPDQVVIFDQLEAPQPAKFRWLMHSHTQNRQDTQARAQQFSIARPHARLDGQMLLPANVEMQMEQSYNILPNQGYSVDTISKPQPEWTLFAENIQPTHRLEFLSAMQISSTRQPAESFRHQLHQDADAVLLETSHAQGKRLILFNRTPGKKVTRESVSTDGAVAVLLLSGNGDVLNAMVADGTTLYLNGQLILQRAKRGNAALFSAPKMLETTSTAVRQNGTPVPLTQYRQTPPNAKPTYLLTGKITIPAEQKMTISLPAGFPHTVHYSFSNTNRRFAGTLSPETPIGEIIPEKGDYLLSLTSREPLKEIELKTAAGQIVPGSPLAADFQVPGDALVIEAEKIHRENQPPAMVAELPTASAGKASAEWSEPGKYAEWDFELPHAGRYRLLVRTATSYSRIIREFTIDNRPLSPQISGVLWDATGGFGYNAAEWRWIELPGTYQLASGCHTLRCKVIAGKANLDCFALIPVQQK